jgi:UDP-N-acetylmuramate--alanine ligase
MIPSVAYLIGVGGAGMSAIARYLLKNGCEVYGYDRAKTSLTEKLEQEGVHVNYALSLTAIPEAVRIKSGKLLLIITPAISSSHPHLIHLKKAGHNAIKRSEFLGQITENKPTLAIAGTHGKTTITAILAHILAGTENGCNAFIGGISANTKSNFYWSSKAKWTVVEADEFDRSFHSLSPTHAVITSLDPDHLDIYGNEERFVEAFEIFADKVKEKLIVCHEIAQKFGDRTNLETYGIEQTGLQLTHSASQIDWSSSGLKFDLNLNHKESVLKNIAVNMMGLHNLENVIAASALAYNAGATLETIKTRLGSFSGIYRRFQIHTNTSTSVYIDDYAHHPTELKKTIEAVRTHFPGRHLTVIFQPHLYSRTQDQQEGFRVELNQADRLILLPIYAARENQIDGFNTQSLFEKISHPHAETSTKNSIFDNLKGHPVDVLLTVGAGDIDLLVPSLKKWSLKYA